MLHRVRGAAYTYLRQCCDLRYGSGIDGELNNELAAERKRMLEERAEVARQNTDRLLKGDVEVLKRSVRDNAQKAGGSN